MVGLFYIKIGNCKGKLYFDTNRILKTITWDF